MLRQACVCVIFVLVAGSHGSSAGAGGSSDARIIKYAFNDNGLGTYSFEYETSDGSYRREDGGLVAGRAGEALVVRGEYGYVDPEGRMRVVHYVADENGYRPQPKTSDTRFNDRRIV